MKTYFKAVNIILILLATSLLLGNCSQDKEKTCFLPSTGILPIPGQTEDECRELLLLDVLANNSRGATQTESQRALLNSSCLIMENNQFPSQLLALRENSDLTSWVGAGLHETDNRNRVGLADAFYEENGARWVGVGRNNSLNGSVFYSNASGKWVQPKIEVAGELRTISKTPDNRYVAMGYNTTNFRSTDITDSSQSNLLVDNDQTRKFTAYSSAFGSGKIVFVGNANTSDPAFPNHITYTENGGETFSDGNYPRASNPYLNEIIFSNNLFVAVGLQGRITTSTDGITWTNQTYGTDELLGIAYHNGMYIVVGRNNRILTSTNPTDSGSWSPVTVSSLEVGSTIQSIAYDKTNNRFLALPYNHNSSTLGTIMSSTNGTSWEVANLEQNRPNLRIRCK